METFLKETFPRANVLGIFFLKLLSWPFLLIFEMVLATHTFKCIYRLTSCFGTMISMWMLDKGDLNQRLIHGVEYLV